jgi:hypothetical protein
MKWGWFSVSMFGLLGCAGATGQVHAPAAVGAAAPAHDPAAALAPAAAADSASVSASAPESASASESASAPAATPSHVAALRDAAQFGMIRLVHAMPAPARRWAEPFPALDSGTALGVFGDDEPHLRLVNPDQGSDHLPRSVDMPIPGIPIPTGEFTLRGRYGGPPLHDVSCIRSPAGTCEMRVAGSLSSDDIRRVIRRHHPRFSFCYESGLRRDPALAGRLEVDFVIGHDGTVVSVRAGKADLKDGDVLSCVVRAFYGITFPAPGAGVVTVSYPLMFSPTN